MAGGAGAGAGDRGTAPPAPAVARRHRLRESNNGQLDQNEGRTARPPTSLPCDVPLACRPADFRYGLKSYSLTTGEHILQMRSAVHHRMKSRMCRGVHGHPFEFSNARRTDVCSINGGCWRCELRKAFFGSFLPPAAPRRRAARRGERARVRGGATPVRAARARGEGLEEPLRLPRPAAAAEVALRCRAPPAERRAEGRRVGAAPMARARHVLLGALAVLCAGAAAAATAGSKASGGVDKVGAAPVDRDFKSRPRGLQAPALMCTLLRHARSAPPRRRALTLSRPGWRGAPAPRAACCAGRGPQVGHLR